MSQEWKCLFGYCFSETNILWLLYFLCFKHSEESLLRFQVGACRVSTCKQILDFVPLRCISLSHKQSSDMFQHTNRDCAWWLWFFVMILDRPFLGKGKHNKKYFKIPKLIWCYSQEIRVHNGRADKDSWTQIVLRHILKKCSIGINNYGTMLVWLPCYPFVSIHCPFSIMSSAPSASSGQVLVQKLDLVSYFRAVLLSRMLQLTNMACQMVLHGHRKKFQLYLLGLINQNLTNNMELPCNNLLCVGTLNMIVDSPNIPKSPLFTSLIKHISKVDLGFFKLIAKSTLVYHSYWVVHGTKICV